MKIRLAVVLRVLGFLLGGLVAVVAALALLVWVSFDAEQTATTLTQHFKDRYQRTLVLGADPQLRIWPRPALLLRQASLTEAGRPETFASAELVRLDLAPLPLLLRHPEVKRIRITGLDAHLSRTRSGEWNLANLLAAPAADAPELPWPVHPDSIQLLESTLHIDDARNELKFEWRDFSVKAADLNQNTPGELDWQGQWVDPAHDSDFHFKGRTHYTLGDRLEAGSLDNLNLQLEGNSSGLQGASAQIVGTRLNWADSGAKGLVDSLSIKLQGASGPQAVSLQASIPRLGWQSSRLQGEKLDAQLTLRAVGAQTDLKLALPQLLETPNGFSSPLLNFSWQHQNGTERGSQGKLTGTLEADVQNSTLRLGKIQGDIAVQHPRLHTPTARMALSGQLQWRANGGTDALLDGYLGEDKLHLQAQLQQLWPLNGRFELGANHLDVDRLLAETRPGAKQPPLGLPDLGKHTLTGKLKLGDLRIAGLHVTSLQTPLTVDKGKLSATGFVAMLYGGQLGGDFSAESSSGRISLQGDGKDLAFERLALEGGLPIPLSGRLSGSYKFSTQLAAGQSPLAALNGAVRWTLANSAIRGVDLVRSLREFRPAIEAGKQSARTPTEAETTELGTTSSRFVFADGKLQAENFQSRNSWLSLNGSGSASLLQDELDFHLSASLLPGITSMSAKDLVSLRGKPLTLRLKGPRLRPDVRYEPGSAVPTTRPAAATTRK
ncbi:MAG: hypothetical protein H6R19_656 [Proteobacteria bacterium]|nr:hypothetical protein [Pseudomonadota bacterium]